MPSKMTMLLTMLLATPVAPCFANPINDAPDDARGVGRATARFYESLNAMFTGDPSPMKQIWSHSDDVTYMGPAGGFQIGWKQVSAAWEAQAALKLGGEIAPEEIHATVAGDLAIVQCREVGHNLDAQGRVLQVSIRATNVFRQEHGQWKMIGHHTDLLPFLEHEPRATPAQ
ncbi:MAG TPA: nuclear transport factor 2 family protein [Pirellulales bacterium]|nr:nuclear transport factor 2 family protein [Pirellulales bacterium]